MDRFAFVALSAAAQHRSSVLPFTRRSLMDAHGADRSS